MQTQLNEIISIYDFLFKSVEKGGVIEPGDAVALFKKSGLDNDILKDVCKILRYITVVKVK